VLVVGVDSLMTQLAKCCKPAPPDAIGGFVTRGKGVSVHRADCSNFSEMAARAMPSG
jgi:GTP pyrophosphokinase